MSDHEIGTIETGKLADFIILKKGPRKVDKTEILKITVLETWMDGKKFIQRKVEKTNEINKEL